MGALWRGAGSDASGGVCGLEMVMLTLAAGGFTVWDWGVLGAYFLLLAGMGWWFSRRKQTGTDDYFRAGRGIPFWAAAVSLLATTQTAVTFLAVPESSYLGDLTYLSASIGGLIAAVVLAAVFIPAYFRANVTTPYELLETRFGPGARVATSCAYIVGRLLASAARVFTGAIPISLIVFGEMEDWQLGVAVAVLMVVGIGYTLMGGIRSVIWTDVVQVGVYLGAAAVAVGVLLWRIPLSVTEIWGVLAATGDDGGASKLTVLRVGLEAGRPGLGFDPSAEFTLLTAVFGFSLLMLGAYGTDQDFVQRTLTCKDARRGGMSVVTGVLVGIPVVALFLVLGLLLWIFYQRPDLMGESEAAAGSADSRRVLLRFIMEQMPPGLTGLMIAGVMAAGLSSVNSTLNSMSSSFVTDLYKRALPGRSEGHYLFVGRAGVVGAGVLLGLVAGLCILWQKASGQTLLSFALYVMVFAYSGLLGVFITALFTRRGSSSSVVAALVTGFAVSLMLQGWALAWWGPRVPVVGDWLAGLKLVNIWHLPIATGAATLVCCMGRRRPAQGVGDAA